ncbi:MAG: dihydrofolate reductase [Clostridiales bacterium]|nr:dihydrofolate reductase [Clostridiales bacterium]
MLALIAAYDDQRVIGFQNQLPWHIPQDLRRFYTLTLGQSILMGRNTYASIGRPLPGRVNYVLSCDKAFAKEKGLILVSSLFEAMEDAKARGLNLYISGGVKVYEQALPYCDFLYLTHIHGSFQGDRHFPSFDPKEYILLLEKKVPPENNTPGFTFYTYGRKAPFSPSQKNSY